MAMGSPTPTHRMASILLQILSFMTSTDKLTADNDIVDATGPFDFC
ncbi:uncharacterized protein G2W53_002798 [Senna tora]|uniref:Uncharacterized protein n=1 Tax=Senna tora TaxID=362788 RepID=A0A834X9D9_9FABA|nr:uncharacterized protein G2W53_002798 [Senna tora]